MTEPSPTGSEFAVLNDSNRPIIGLTTYRQPAQTGVWNVEASFLPAEYFDAVNRAGATAILLPPQPVSTEGASAIISNLDGLIICGGRDVDANLYGQSTGEHTDAPDKLRDAFELALYSAAIEVGLPFLGICRGQQVLNVHQGGTLIQHIPEAVPRALHHRDPVERHNRHIIEIVEGTRCWDIYGPGEIRVNSEHHMAVNRLASCFKASAHAPDGVIECYESTDADWFCLGVQWHPEDDTASALDMQVFQEFMSAAHGSEPTILKMPQRVAA